MPESALALGIDLGTSAVKVAVLDAGGAVVGAGSASFATASERPLQAEQEPSDWLGALGAAMAVLGAELDPRAAGWRGSIRAIGLAGQLPTLVCLGAAGPAGRAITWKDGRADAWASQAISASERRSLYRDTGMLVDGRYLGPMFHQHWLPRRAEVTSVLSAKDYLAFALTGERVTDPSTAAGYAAFSLFAGAFDASWCERWGLPLATLPSVRPAHAIAGRLNRAGASLLGLPAGVAVTVGSADSVASAYAMAGLEEGIVAVTMGSSTIIIDAVREARLDPKLRYLLTPHVEAGWFGREMDLLATGTGYGWLGGLFGWEDGALDRAAATSVAGAHGLTFTPYLGGGEQGALWNPALRGELRGLALHHTRADIARAFLEGVCFEIRRCLEVLGETVRVRGIVLGGHLVGEPASLRMLTDILGLPVQPFTQASAAAVGAALGALRGAGGVAAARLAGSMRPPVAPGPASPGYERLYARYRSVAG